MEGNKENAGNEAANGGEQACTATKKPRLISSILFADPPLTAAAGKQTVQEPDLLWDSDNDANMVRARGTRDGMRVLDDDTTDDEASAGSVDVPASEGTASEVDGAEAGGEEGEEEEEEEREAGEEGGGDGGEEAAESEESGFGGVVVIERPEHVLKGVFEAETPEAPSLLYHIAEERDEGGRPMSAREAVLYLFTKVGHLWTTVRMGREKYVVYVCKVGGGMWGDDVDGWLHSFYTVLIYTNKKGVVKRLLENATMRNEIKGMLKHYNQVSHADWVKRTDVVPRFMYPCRNGMLHMVNLSVTPYTYADMMTAEAIDTALEIKEGMLQDPAVLEQEAYISERMDEIFPERELRLNVVGRIAYCFLTGEPMKFRQFIILEGQGSNGKSAFMEMYASLFPKLVVAYAGSTDNPVAHKRAADSGAPNSLAMKLKGKRVIFCKDYPDEIASAGMLKNLAGDASFIARDLHEKATQIDVVGILVIGTNTPLRFSHYEEALMNRLLAYVMPSKFCKMSDPQQAEKANDPDEHLCFPADEDWDRRFKDDEQKSKLALIRYTARVYTEFLPIINAELKSEYDMRALYLDSFDKAKLIEDARAREAQRDMESREQASRHALARTRETLDDWLCNLTTVAEGEVLKVSELAKELETLGCPGSVRGITRGQFTDLITPWLTERNLKMTRAQNVLRVKGLRMKTAEEREGTYQPTPPPKPAWSMVEINPPPPPPEPMRTPPPKPVGWFDRNWAIVDEE